MMYEASLDEHATGKFERKLWPNSRTEEDYDYFS